MIVSNQLCTTSFLVEISQFIKFGDLTTGEASHLVLLDAEPTLVTSTAISQLFSTDGADGMRTNAESQLTNEEEDVILRVRPFTSISFLVSIPSRIQLVVSRTGLPVSFVGLFSC